MQDYYHKIQKEKRRQEALHDIRFAATLCVLLLVYFLVVYNIFGPAPIQ